jgi:hypothetical protein
MSYDDVQQVLTGHNSPETAFIQDDYPYGRSLRCKRRVWVETATKGAKKGQQRFVAQTTNPRRAVESWNKPKGSTYSDIIILYLDSKDHVQQAALSTYSSPEEIARFVERFGEHLTPAQQNSIRYLDAVQRVSRRINWTISVGSTETREERDARKKQEHKTLNAMLVQELRTPSKAPIL